MKYFLALILFPVLLTGQNLIDPPSLITDSTSNKDIISRNQNAFLLGWNWGREGRKLDEALFTLISAN